MNQPEFSVIIPVYNRPDEVEELLESLLHQQDHNFETIIVEDGSSIPCLEVVERYAERIDIKYFTKANSGPGSTRNYGAERSQGEYLIFFDSDCLIPSTYFTEVNREILTKPVDAFGGPDSAHKSFSNIQKAINYSMTSFFTTGGIRGGKERMDKFYPRSFNMGISKKVFNELGGFSKMRFGEDVDFSLRIIKAGYTTRLFPQAYVYHKRRTDFRKFYRQVYNSGIARVNLHLLHPGSLKLVHVLPSAFVVGMAAMVIVSIIFPVSLLLPLAYCLLVFSHSILINTNPTVALLSVPAAWVQLFGYGLGFLDAALKRLVFRKKEYRAFEKNFYR